ncbi:MreB/Mrl family cell shape determining protein [candidate division WWE3 bacterium]|nr:MreB/Mrl family cell shape determining protein [candidate division WWE3 bacterium]
MLTKKLAIDLGTANSIVYVKNKGISLMEPTVVAVSEEGDSILAVGSEAKKMLGRTPEDIVALRPLRSGVIADYRVTEILIKYLIRGAIGKSRFIKPDVVISIPAGATSVESRAVLEAAYSAGAKKAYLVPEPLAAAIGAGLPVSQPSGNIIVNIGGGTTEIAVVSLYGIVVHGSTRVGGNDFDDAIVQHLRREHGLVIGSETAEGVKINLGSAIGARSVDVIEVKGRDSVTGFPRIVEVSSAEINACMERDLERIAMAVKDVLESTPPELSSDILDKGIVLSGGTSQLKNIDKYISGYIGVPVHVADEPILCVVKGLGEVLDHLEMFSKSMIGR